MDSGQGGADAIVYSPDGTMLATGGSDGTIRLWDAADGKERRRIIASKKGIRSIAFSPDGNKLAAGSDEDSLRLWDVATGRQIRAFGEKQVQFSPVAFSRDGKLLAAGYGDGTFSVWDATSGEEKHLLRAGVGRARSVAFSPDGKTLATAVLWDGCLRLWDVASGREKITAEGPHGPIPLLRFAADKKTLISAGFDRNILWWDLATQTPHRRFTWTTNSFNGIALSPDANTLAVADHATFEVCLWDVRTGKSEKLPFKHKKGITNVVFSPDGRLLASSGQDGAIHVWDARERKEPRQIMVDGVQTMVRGVLFSPDGKTLACETMSFGGRATMTTRLWGVASGKELRILADHLIGESPSAFSPDGKVLATVNDAPGRRGESLVRLWDTTTGKELCRHSGHRSAAHVAFSPDGKLVVSGGSDEEDNSIHVWEAATGRLIRRFDGHHSWVWAVTFAADGLTVASSAGDSTILIWDITDRQQDGKLRSSVLSTRQLESCWTALANDDAAKAYDAVWALAAAPEQAVPFLRKRLPPVPIPDANLVARHIAELDSDDFATRQRAAEELSKYGDAITPALQRALDGKPALEVRRRVQHLLDQCRDWNSERLRAHRAIQALEHIGTSPAREALQTLTAGAPASRLTEEAKMALRRIGR
jgi:WD40 repeat protein